MKTTQPNRHPFTANGIKDFHGHQHCLTCGLPDTHERHTLLAAPAEATQHDAAILGEHEEN